MQWSTSGGLTIIASEAVIGRQSKQENRMPHTFEEVCGAVARGWCAPENAHKEMDIDLATAIAKEVWKLQSEQNLNEAFIENDIATVASWRGIPWPW